jgi:hypothetical protein
MNLCIFISATNKCTTSVQHYKMEQALQQFEARASEIERQHHVLLHGMNALKEFCEKMEGDRKQERQDRLDWKKRQVSALERIVDIMMYSPDAPGASESAASFSKLASSQQ